MYRQSLFLACALYSFACSRPPSPEAEPGVSRPASPEHSPPDEQRASAGQATETLQARVGEPAPEFSLPDLDGRRVALSTSRGKTVVLEWFNPECPFVNKAHTVGSLVDTAARQEQRGVVWLAVNSSAPDRQGHGVEKNREARARLGLRHPVLLDESGDVGRRYGARTTPHMYVIDASGVLVYQGAIDNSPDAEGESPTDGRLVNYVDAALAALDAGRPVAAPNTEPYGCSVKYSD
ncbi:MAG TPA: redoxin family protein [Polyangiaceae bacterium]